MTTAEHWHVMFFWPSARIKIHLFRSRKKLLQSCRVPPSLFLEKYNATCHKNSYRHRICTGSTRLRFPINLYLQIILRIQIHRSWSMGTKVMFAFTWHHVTHYTSSKNVNCQWITWPECLAGLRRNCVIRRNIILEQCCDHYWVEMATLHLKQLTS